MAKSKGGSVAARTMQIIAPFAEEMGYDIWDVQFVREGTEWCLRIIIDKEDGISIDDCEKFSRAINDPIDELDPTEESWSLEVSSPGIERELTKPAHFEKMAGRDVRIQLYRPHPVIGDKEVIAQLVRLEDKEMILADLDGVEFSIALKDAVSVRIYEEIEEE